MFNKLFLLSRKNNTGGTGEVDPKSAYYDIITENGTNLSYVFKGRAITELPNIDMSNVRKAMGMCEACTQLTEVTIDMSNLEDASGMFSGCYNLKTLNIVGNTSKLKNVSTMFHALRHKDNNYSSKFVIPYFNTSNVENFSNFYQSGPNIERFPEYDYSSAKDLTSMLSYAFVRTCPVMNTAKATTFTYMFSHSNIVTIEGIDFSSSQGTGSVFNNAKLLQDIIINGVLQNGDVVFTHCTKLTVESVKSIINALVDYAGTDKEHKYAVYFSSETLGLIEAEGTTAPNGLTWLEYIDSKGWNC